MSDTKISALPSGIPATNDILVGVSGGADIKIPINSLPLPLAGLNFRGELLPNWRKAIAKMRDGGGDAKILCLGDSTTFGTGDTTAGTLPISNAYPARLATLLNSYYAPAAQGLGIPQPSGINNNWTVGSNWSNAGTGFGFGDKTAWTSTNVASNALVYTPNSGATADRFTIYYLGYPSTQTITATATGGSPVSQVTTTGGPPGSVGSFTVSAATSATTNSVSMTGNGSVFVTGVEPWDSTVSRVRVANAGVPASTTDQHANSLNPQYGSVAMIEAYAPDLTIISLGINDSAAAVAAATVIANLNTLIAAGKVSGDVILMTFPPSGSGAGSWANYSVYQPQYIAAIDALAVSSGIPLVDWYTRFGSAFNPLFQNTSDYVHCNNYGYWDIAEAIFSALSQV